MFATHAERLSVVVVVGCWLCRILENDLSGLNWNPPKECATPLPYEHGGNK
jgi:hypothetical protein